MVSPVEADTAAERWRSALAELAYAERHGSPAAEVEVLESSVIEARVAMFQAAGLPGRALPTFLTALSGDLEERPGNGVEIVLP